MQKKNITIISGDSYDLGFRVSRPSGPIDLTLPGTLLYAHVTDLSGTQIVRAFDILDVDMVAGRFKIHLDPSATLNLRGRYEWYVKWEYDGKKKTFSGGDFTVSRNF